MPAVTADTLTLPRLPKLPDRETLWRPVAQVSTAHRQLEGEGFVVRRAFPGAVLSMADPFLLLDHMGAVEYAPGEAKGTPWHQARTEVVRPQAGGLRGVGIAWRVSTAASSSMSASTRRRRSPWSRRGTGGPPARRRSSSRYARSSSSLA